MIELTKEEALTILQTLAMFEGFLFSVEGQGARSIADLLEHPVDLLVEKLKND
ncbi:MAG: hypothetical protein PHR19_02485 [Bacteroidales bacterium]|nr:hypothetical protein [Bacteroidales bacterium]